MAHDEKDKLDLESEIDLLALLDTAEEEERKTEEIEIVKPPYDAIKHIASIIHTGVNIDWSDFPGEDLMKLLWSYSLVTEREKIDAQEFLEDSFTIKYFILKNVFKRLQYPYAFDSEEGLEEMVEKARTFFRQEVRFLNDVLPQSKKKFDMTKEKQEVGGLLYQESFLHFLTFEPEELMVAGLIADELKIASRYIPTLQTKEEIQELLALTTVIETNKDRETQQRVFDYKKRKDRGADEVMLYSLLVEKDTPEDRVTLEVLHYMTARELRAEQRQNFKKVLEELGTNTDVYMKQVREIGKKLREKRGIIIDLPTRMDSQKEYDTFTSSLLERVLNGWEAVNILREFKLGDEVITIQALGKEGREYKCGVTLERLPLGSRGRLEGKKLNFMEKGKMYSILERLDDLEMKLIRPTLIPGINKSREIKVGDKVEIIDGSHYNYSTEGSWGYVRNDIGTYWHIEFHYLSGNYDKQLPVTWEIEKQYVEGVFQMSKEEKVFDPLAEAMERGELVYDVGSKVRLKKGSRFSKLVRGGEGVVIEHIKSDERPYLVRFSKTMVKEYGPDELEFVKRPDTFRVMRGKALEQERRRRIHQLTLGIEEVVREAEMIGRVREEQERAVVQTFVTQLRNAGVMEEVISYVVREHHEDVLRDVTYLGEDIVEKLTICRIRKDYQSRVNIIAKRVKEREGIVLDALGVNSKKKYEEWIRDIENSIRKAYKVVDRKIEGGIVAMLTQEVERYTPGTIVKVDELCNRGSYHVSLLRNKPIGTIHANAADMVAVERLFAEPQLVKGMKLRVRENIKSDYSTDYFNDRIRNIPLGSEVTLVEIIDKNSYVVRYQDKKDISWSVDWSIKREYYVRGGYAHFHEDELVGIDVPQKEMTSEMARYQEMVRRVIEEVDAEARTGESIIAVAQRAMFDLLTLGYDKENIQHIFKRAGTLEELREKGLDV